MNFARNKKGTDKPIEIFIALFIILAIAMLMLRMFSDQLKEKTNELKRQEQKARLDQQKQDALNECNDVCSRVTSNGCDEQSQVSFCLHKIGAGIDLNANGEIRSDEYGEEYAFGACETNVYCPLVTRCDTCGRNLDFKTCFQLVCQFFKDQITGPNATTRVALEMFDRYEFGECLTPEEKANKLTWDTALIPEVSSCLGIPTS
ncbi:hypothetical protein D6783_03430 [Candidatus Woesearchaeota archaeon]|nr:MAG: hypothetical protein D6783_03430 [Candidatus Woesearchaeota archaeon]